jgi:hypothetical protein
VYGEGGSGRGLTGCTGGCAAIVLLVPLDECLLRPAKCLIRYRPGIPDTAPYRGREVDVLVEILSEQFP